MAEGYPRRPCGCAALVRQSRARLRWQGLDPAESHRAGGRGNGCSVGTRPFIHLTLVLHSFVTQSAARHRVGFRVVSGIHACVCDLIGCPCSKAHSSCGRSGASRHGTWQPGRHLPYPPTPAQARSTQQRRQQGPPSSSGAVVASSCCSGRTGCPRALPSQGLCHLIE